MEARRVDVDELRQEIARDQVIVLDVRTGKAWDASDVKIPGAVRVEPDDVDAAMARLSRQRAIVTYCT